LATCGKSEEHKEQLFIDATSSLLQRIYDKEFDLPVTYVINDGLVPISSARFDGVNVAKRVECPFHDHLDMRDDPDPYAHLGDRTEDRLCKNGDQRFSLFRSIAEDLIEISQVNSTMVLSINQTAFCVGDAWNLGVT